MCDRNISNPIGMSVQSYIYICCFFFSSIPVRLCVIFLPHTPLQNDWQCLVDLLRLQGPGLWQNKADAGCRIPLWLLNLEAAWKQHCVHMSWEAGAHISPASTRTGPVAMENRATMDEATTGLPARKQASDTNGSTSFRSLSFSLAYLIVGVASTFRLSSSLSFYLYFSHSQVQCFGINLEAV